MDARTVVITNYTCSGDYKERGLVWRLPFKKKFPLWFTLTENVSLQLQSFK